MDYVISPGREFADGCRIQDEGDTIPNSGEFGSCPRIRHPSADSLLEETTQLLNNSDKLILIKIGKRVLCSSEIQE